jgi:hypothetical protein
MNKPTAKPPQSVARVATRFAGKRLAQAVAMRAFAKKAPIIGALMASEDIFKKLVYAGHDYLSGHSAGAQNELQQAITHAVGAGVNLLGGASIIGMTAGVVAQTLAQQHAANIAAQKPIAPMDKRTLYGKFSDKASQSAALLQTAMTMQQQIQALKPRSKKKKSEHNK